MKRYWFYLRFCYACKTSFRETECSDFKSWNTLATIQFMWEISVGVYIFARIFFEVLTGIFPFKDIPLRNILQSICDRVRLGFIRCGLLSWYVLFEKCWSTNAVKHPWFHVVCHLLVDYKAIVLKHPYGLEHVPHDNPQEWSFLVQLILSGSLEDVASHNDGDLM